MAINYTVTSVGIDNTGDESKYLVWHDVPNSAAHVTVFPFGAVEWRAAEYNIDATTVAGRSQIMDILLHEPFMEAVPPALLTKARKRLAREAHEEVHLFNASTRDEARAAHLAKLQRTKEQRVNVVWSGNPLMANPNPGVRALNDPAHLLMIHPLDLASLAQKTDHVMSLRMRLGLEPAPPVTIPTVPAQYYDPAIRRRGLTVVIKDS
jgi:hypothetical protein